MRSDQRIVRQVLPSGATYDGIYEVFYDEVGHAISRSDNLTTLLGPNTEDLKSQVAHIKVAFSKPILLQMNEFGARFVELDEEGRPQ